MGASRGSSTGSGSTACGAGAATGASVMGGQSHKKIAVLAQPKRVCALAKGAVGVGLAGRIEAVAQSQYARGPASQRKCRLAGARTRTARALAGDVGLSPSEVPKATATSGLGSVHMVGKGLPSLPVISRSRSFTNLIPAPDARFTESPYLNFCGQALGSATIAQPPRTVDRRYTATTDTTRMTTPSTNCD